MTHVISSHDSQQPNAIVDMDRHHIKDELYVCHELHVTRSGKKHELTWFQNMNYISRDHVKHESHVTWLHGTWITCLSRLTLFLFVQTLHDMDVTLDEQIYMSPCETQHM